MDFADKIQEIAGRIPRQMDLISTEEATKNAFIMPFISALGYDIFDPSEVTPELTADVGVKKGEKVDYAILKEGHPIILFECKWHGYDLNKAHASQLFRYFSVTKARFAILTNGLTYRFFTDLETPNKMDSKHFFEFNILDYDDRELDELKKFTKFAYDEENILTTASELKYTRAIRKILDTEWSEPSDDLVRFFAGQVYSGRLTKNVRDEFHGIVKKALSQFLTERINKRLENALATEEPAEIDGSVEGETTVEKPEQSEADEDNNPSIVTTDEELEAFGIVKAIMSEVVDPDRVVMRDVQSYCGILLDDNNRQPICRLRFNYAQNRISLFDEDKNEENIEIDSLQDIYKYKDRLRATVQYYE